MNVIQKRAEILLSNGTGFTLAVCMSLWLMSAGVLARTIESQAGNTVDVVVSSTGCTPSSATKPIGPVTLKVTNQTGEAELSVQLYGSRGELIREAYIRQGATEWSETFNLPAGSYRLIAGHKPEWVFHLTVQ